MKQRLFPLWLALAICVGVLIGRFCSPHAARQIIGIPIASNDKLSYLLQAIRCNYVDTIDMDSIIEQALPMVLAELDPHSSYIPAEDSEESVEDLKGQFSGIGVRFVVQKDTVRVMNVVKGGPSEKVGILAGDRIVAADDSSLIAMPQRDIMRQLRGPKGTQVTLTVCRPGRADTLRFIVERGEVPVESVDASFMIGDHTGYIAVKSFGERTYPEMLTALVDLQVRGMSGLIIDLRGNRGGYMQTAIQMVNEFLAADQLIVYTEGCNFPREEFRADGRGSFRQLPLCVLVDEGSASAAEIFAGAVQDNDRGTIVGRRSFGKGLVQQPIDFSDGSVVRLTVARYYTPAGRCIQKPYVKGHGEEYENDLLERYERGEFFSADSIHQQGPEYKTLQGRTVYGGGGIMPDIFVPEDTTLYTTYYKAAVYAGLVHQFTLAYADRHRADLQPLGDDVEAMVRWLQRQDILAQFVAFATQQGLKPQPLMLQRSAPLFLQTLYANIIYDAGDEAMRLRYYATIDPTIQRAIDVLDHPALP